MHVNPVSLIRDLFLFVMHFEKKISGMKRVEDSYIVYIVLVLMLRVEMTQVQ